MQAVLLIKKKKIEKRLMLMGSLPCIFLMVLSKLLFETGFICLLQAVFTEAIIIITLLILA